MLGRGRILHLVMLRGNTTQTQTQTHVKTLLHSKVYGVTVSLSIASTLNVLSILTYSLGIFRIVTFPDIIIDITMVHKHACFSHDCIPYEKSKSHDCI